MQTAIALNQAMNVNISSAGRPTPTPIPAPQLELVSLERDEVSNLRREIVREEYERPVLARSIS